MNDFVAYDPSRRVVFLRLVAGLDGANAGMSFNGVARGAVTVTIPVGWRVEAVFLNDDGMLPHSVAVVRAARPVPATVTTPAFAGASSAKPAEGILQGEASRFSFRADQEGAYLLICAVPGHGQAGMYINLTVAPGVSAPTVGP